MSIDIPAKSIASSITCPEQASALITELVRTYGVSVIPETVETPVELLPATFSTEIRRDWIASELDDLIRIAERNGRQGFVDMLTDLNTELLDLVMNAPSVVKDGSIILDTKHQNFRFATHAITDQLYDPTWTAQVSVSGENGSVDILRPDFPGVFRDASEAWAWTKAHEIKHADRILVAVLSRIDVDYRPMLTITRSYRANRTH